MHVELERRVGATLAEQTRGDETTGAAGLAPATAAQRRDAALEGLRAARARANRAAGGREVADTDALGARKRKRKRGEGGVEGSHRGGGGGGEREARGRGCRRGPARAAGGEANGDVQGGRRANDASVPGRGRQVAVNETNGASSFGTDGDARRAPRAFRGRSRGVSRANKRCTAHVFRKCHARRFTQENQSSM